MHLTWVFPPLFGSFLLVGVYGYLSSRYPDPFLRTWTRGWALYTLRFAALVPVALGATGPVWKAANQFFALWSGILLLQGVREYQGKRPARGWIVAGIGLSAWIAVGPALSVRFAPYTLPTFAFLGFVNLEAGRVLLRGEGRFAGEEGPARLPGIAFVLWGLHKWDYPFLARSPWAALWGYALGAVLGLATAVGLLVTYLERERDRAERNRLFLRGVLDAIPDRVAVLDRELRVLDVNRAAGAVPAPDRSLACRELWGANAPPCEAGDCVAAEALERGGTVRATRRIPGEEGGPAVFDVVAAPLRDRAGRIIGAVRVARNVTERETLTEQISRAAAEWTTTFDAVPDLIVVTDGARVIRRANRGLARRLGREPRDLVGRTLDEVGLAGLAEVSLVQGFGEWESSDLGGVFLVSATRVQLGDGEADGWVYVGRDVTRQKEVEKALARERWRLAELLRALSDGVLAVSRDGKVTFVNPAAERLCGRSREAALGVDVEDVLGGWRGDPLVPAVNGVLSGGEPRRGEGVIAGALGERQVELQVLPLSPGDEAAQGCLVVIRDVTEARALERERVRTQHLEALGIFAAGIAHDFNNLLMGISGNLELAERRLARGPEAAGVLLGRAREACARAAGLARQLLTFSRGGEPARRRMNLAGVIEDWVRFPLAGSAVVPSFEVEPDLPDLEVDGEQIHQVVTNLVVNALQAMPGGGRLRVQLDAVDLGEGAASPPLPPGRYVRLTVADEGCGIPPEHLARVFDPFFTTKPDGSGLGLATSYSVVRRHGGAIHVASEPGRGTTVVVYLPAAGTPANDGEAPPKGYKAPSLRGLRILAMDDDPVLREILAERLAEAGIEARVVSSGEEAVEAFAGALRAGTPPHAVVLDLTVRGGLGGVEAMKRIRDLSGGVFAVAVSGYADAPAVARPREHGFNAAISKPYSLSDLLGVIGDGIGGKAG